MGDEEFLRAGCFAGSWWMDNWCNLLAAPEESGRKGVAVPDPLTFIDSSELLDARDCVFGNPDPVVAPL